MKIPGSEYADAILEFLIKNGHASKYAIAKGTDIPYPTVLRNLPKMTKAHVVHKIGEGKRGAEIYAATPKGTIIAYFHGRVRTSELFMALPAIMKHVPLSLEDLPVVKDPLGFIIEELLFKLSQLEDLKLEEAVSILGAILIWRHDEWYHEIGKENLKRLLSWNENYQILRMFVAGAINTLDKMNEQSKSLSEHASYFIVEMDECANR